jgi:hypothetical protein
MKTGTVRLLHHIVIFFGILFLLWGLIQGQKYVLNKDVGVEGTGMITTETVSPGSIVFVDATASKRMDTRLVRMDNRDLAYVGNSSYYDRHLSAGGPGDGNGVGTKVSLQAMTPTETRYALLIKAPTDSSVDYTEAEVNYKVEINIWTPNYMLIMTGIVLIFSAMVLGTVLGIGLFGPGVYRPRQAAPVAPPPDEEYPEEVEPAPAPAPAYRRPAPAAVPPPEPAYEPKVEVREEELPPEPAPPPKRGEPTWDAAPSRVEKGVAKPPVDDKKKPLKKIKCSACGAIIPIYTAERPLRVTCPLCGRQGTLTR